MKEKVNNFRPFFFKCIYSSIIIIIILATGERVHLQTHLVSDESVCRGQMMSLLYINMYLHNRLCKKMYKQLYISNNGAVVAAYLSPRTGSAEENSYDRSSRLHIFTFYNLNRRWLLYTSRVAVLYTVALRSKKKGRRELFHTDVHGGAAAPWRIRTIVSRGTPTAIVKGILVFFLPTRDCSAWGFYASTADIYPPARKLSAIVGLAVISQRKKKKKQAIFRGK